MKLSGHEDLRVQKTIQSIRTAFSVMLLKEDYRKITVTALCRQAVINKRLFIATMIVSMPYWKKSSVNFLRAMSTSLPIIGCRRIWIRSTLPFFIMLSIRDRCMKRFSAPYRISI